MPVNQVLLVPRTHRPRLLHVALLALAKGEEPSTRQRVFKLVQERPGLHQRDLARRLGMRSSHAEYHLHQLVKTGLLKSQRSGRYTRYFVAVEPLKARPGEGVPPADRPWLAVLREARPLELVAHLLQEDDVPSGELAKKTGLAASTVSYHIDKLEEVGIVRRERHGTHRLIALEDRDRLVRVLLEYEPPDDLVEGFEDLWDDLGL